MTEGHGRVDEHARRFNDAVRTGRYESFVTGFAPDATMTFAGLPYGPFVGRAAILEAYLAQPPTETLTVTWIDADADRDVVMVAWSDGGTGTMTLEWDDGLVTSLTVAFD